MTTSTHTSSATSLQTPPPFPRTPNNAQSSASPYILPINHGGSSSFNYIQMAHLTSGNDIVQQQQQQQRSSSFKHSFKSENNHKISSGIDANEASGPSSDVYHLPWENSKLIKSIQQQQSPPPLPSVPPPTSATTTIISSSSSSNIRPRSSSSSSSASNNNSASSLIPITSASNNDRQEEENYDNNAEAKTTPNANKQESEKQRRDEKESNDDDDGDQYCAPWDLKMQEGKWITSHLNCRRLGVGRVRYSSLNCIVLFI